MWYLLRFLEKKILNLLGKHQMGSDQLIILFDYFIQELVKQRQQEITSQGMSKDINHT